MIRCMGWSLEQVCQHYPEALELDLLLLNMLRIVVLVAGAHELVPVALVTVVEAFSCSELAINILLFQIYWQAFLVPQGDLNWQML